LALISTLLVDQWFIPALGQLIGAMTSLIILPFKNPAICGEIMEIFRSAFKKTTILKVKHKK